MQCVVLAGGLATRLWPVTKQIPKALIPINGRPFADYQLAWIARQKISDVVFCVGFLGAQIRSFVGDGARWQLRVRYADEGNQLKGTGGALRIALDAGLLEDHFFVLYGDSFLPVDTAPVLEAFRACGLPALMTVMRNENQWDTSNVEFATPLVRLYDKGCDAATRARMHYIDYGLSVISRDLIGARIATGAHVDLADIFKTLSLAGELGGFEVTERFYEVGSQRGIDEFSRFAAQSGL